MIRILLLPLLTLMVGVLGNSAPKYDGNEKFSYPEHLTGAFTGGFGEETCHSCHFDNDLNPEQGSLTVTGIEEPVTQGEVVEIQIALEREELKKGGFQLTARFEDGSQAGQFDIEGNERLMETKSVGDSHQYIQHSEQGTETDGDHKNTWRVRWKAPEISGEAVIFNIAANAANGDQSEFGDYIFAEEIKLPLK